MTNLPAYLINRKSRNLVQAAVKGLGGGSVPYISIAGNRFTLIDAAGNEKGAGYMHEGDLSLDVVIIDVNQNVSKIYYDGPFDPKAKEFKPPTCFSDNGVGASMQATSPQSLSCMACPHNVWGSAVSNMTGKQTKECNDVKKIAVLVPSFDEGKIVFQLRIPPATLKNFGKFAKLVGASTLGDRPTDLSDIITRVSFESQGILKFAGASYIDEDIASRLEELEDGEITGAIVGRNDTPYQGAVVLASALREPTKEAVVQASAQAPQRSATTSDIHPGSNPATAILNEEPKGRGRPAGAKNKPKADLSPREDVKVEDEEPEEIPNFLRPQARQREDAPITAPDTDLQKALASAFNLPT